MSAVEPNGSAPDADESDLEPSGGVDRDEVHPAGGETGIWGPLAERYERPRKQRRLLALDGGGIRGVLTLEVLAAIESRLAERTGRGDAFRLCDFFDYIAGTSTGAIIAAGLARGFSVTELLSFYVEHGPLLFKKAPLWRRPFRFYDARALTERLQEIYGVDTDLFPEHLRCLLLVVTRNVSTDSPWPISSNPRAKYNDRERPDCNLKIPLWKLVRASTAAPVYFDPEVICLDPNNPEKTTKVFVDGGVTPYNNPAFLLYKMATLPRYRLEWATGESRMMLISVGTGEAAQVETALIGRRSLVRNLQDLPGALMYGAQVDQDVNCRVVGRCVAGTKIDREIGDLIPAEPWDRDLGRDFLYARYNAELSADGLEGLGVSGVDPVAVQQLDAVAHIEELREIGRAVGERVDLAPFERFIESGSEP